MNQRENILVVDDDAAGRYLKVHLLSKAGYRVLEAASGKECRDLIDREFFALALLDVKLPDINGIQLCQDIKKLKPDIMIIQTSAAFITKQDRSTGLTGGADAYLTEPIDPQELRATVEALLRRYRDVERLRGKQEALEQVIVRRGQQIAEMDAQLRTEIDQREDAEELLRHAQKLDVLGQLTGGIAHDFNNVLTIIMGNLESLRRRLDRKSPEHAHLVTYSDNAYYGAQRAVAITRQLLAFSRRQKLVPKVLNINAMLLNLKQMLRQVLGEKIEIETQFAPDLWPVSTDQDQLETAILNLALNARDAMSNGGRLTLTTSNVFKDPANPNAGVAAEVVALTVTDTGTGMSEDVLKLAVEPFFTTKDVGHGTGLGLSQVHGFMKQTGGRIEIKSKLGSGTGISLFLPRYHGDLPAPDHPEAKAAPVVDARRACILVVEDDDAVRAHTGSILREMGHVVVEAETGSKALAALGLRPEINMIVTDIGLPGGISGAQVGRAARNIRPNIKVLYVTGYADEKLRKEGVSADDPIITKPFTFETLTQKVASLLNMGNNGGIVLVVEDEPMIRMDIVDSLRDMGLDVREAASIKEANTQLEGGDIGAVVLDVGLPDGRGDELAVRVRAAHPELPLIIATGYGGETVQKQFATDPHARLLTKPYFATQVQDALKAMGFLRA